MQATNKNNLFPFHPTRFAIAAISFLIGFTLAVLSPETSPIGISLAGLAAIFATFTT